MERGLLLLGLSAYLLWLSWSFEWVSVVLFTFGLLFCALPLARSALGARQFLPFSILITFMFLSHAVGIFLPETGFDAVWYHLPITEVATSARESVFIPELYQSAMPRLGSYLFVFPYMWFGVAGVKVFVYLLGLVLLRQVYRLSCIFLPAKTSMLASVVFLSFHTIAWQMSSAYVDTLRTIFEISALLLMVEYGERRSVLAGVFLGFSLATKLLSLFFFPVFIFYAVLRRGWKYGGITLLSAIVTILPWYVQAYQWTGNPLYPLFRILNGVEQLNGLRYQSVAAWIMHGLMKIPVLPVVMSMNTESYTTPLFLFSFPFLLVSFRTLPKHLKHMFAITLLFMGIWLLIPPVSVRYALTGFILSMIVCLSVLRTRNTPRWLLYGVCGVGIVVNMTIRLGAHAAALPYFTGKETVREYIGRHSVGISKGPMEKWYGGYWKTYQAK